MTLVNKLAKYYKSCLYEEAKVSAFSDLHREDNIVVKLRGNEKVFHNFPDPYAVQEESADLTKIMLKAAIDKKKQLLYGYMFITGELEDGTKIYTPLIYADSFLERINGKMTVSVNSDTVSLNLPALVQLINGDEKEVVVSQLSSIKVNLPLSDEDTKSIEKTISDLIPALDVTGVSSAKVHLNRENAVILTTINKGLAGVINDLDLISTAPRLVLEKTSLKNAFAEEEKWNSSNVKEVVDSCKYPTCNGVSTDLEKFRPAYNLDLSQKQAVKSTAKETITAITGGPGTGKSTTITGIATNYLLNGKTVLICSKMNSAVDVVYNKLKQLSTLPFCVRTGGKEYRKNLAILLDNITSNTYNIAEVTTPPVLVNSILDSEERVNTYNKLEQEYDSLMKKHNMLEQKRDKAPDWFSKQLYKFQSNKCANKLGDVSYVKAECERKLIKENTFTNWLRGTFDYFVPKRNLAKVVFYDNALRREIMLYANALRKSELDKYDYRQAFKEIVEEKVLPCWCTTTVDVSSSIPFIAGLFDVVIIDEASQCDIASCLPLLYRAKRAVIVGDNNQLKHLSFLPAAINNANIESNELGKYSYICNYKDNSIFDFANFFSKGNIMLKQQYRGFANFMNFSNKKFYNNAIKNDKLSDDNNSIQVIQVNGAISAGKTVNNEECKEIIKQIKDIVQGGNDTTIGILSPFRDQVKHIEKIICNVFTLEEIEKHKILVGTAHSFQGEERDIMFLSWTVADNSPVQQFTFINNPNLFNVSITRANKQVRNFISVNNLPKGLLKEYIEYCKQGGSTPADNI